MKNTANRYTYDVFISFASEDQEKAEVVYSFLCAKGLSVFFSPVTLPELSNSDFKHELYEAIDKSMHMVVVTTRPEYAMKTEVKAEWSLFVKEIDAGRKKGNLLAILADDLNPDHLHIVLRNTQFFKWEKYQHDILPYVRSNDLHYRRFFESGSKETLVMCIGEEDYQFIYVEGGSFLMGATHQQEAFDNSYPAGKVEVTHFYMAEFPVTQKLWQAVMGDCPARFDSSSSRIKGNTANHPVENITRTEIAVFLERLNEEFQVCFRLPTEAEWEFAARGGNKSNGYLYSGSNDPDEVCWYRYNSGGRTHRVGLKKPNELGLYDMSGNVWEWTSDRYISGNVKGRKEYIRRGGSWYHVPENCRVSTRMISKAIKRTSGLGFRLVLHIPFDKEEFQSI